MSDRCRGAVRMGVVGLLVGLALGLSLTALHQPAPVRADAAHDQASGLRIVAASHDRLVVELDVPAYALQTVAAAQEQFQRIVIPGATSLTQPGKPELPMFSALIGVPAEGRVSVRVLKASGETLPGRYRILPAAKPLPPASDLQAGTTQRLPDDAAYASAAYYPAEVARVAETAWLRDQRLARIEVFPFQYQAATGLLRWQRHVQIEIKFEGAGTPDRLAAAPASSGPFEQLLRVSLLNYDGARHWRSHVAAPLVAAGPAITTPQYKIVVDRDDLYRVTYTDLLSAGLVMTAFDPHHLRLTNQGLAVAVAVVGEDDGQFDPGDYLLFYGQRLRGDLLASKHATEADDWVTLNGWRPQFNAAMVEKYTDDNVYWLDVGAAPGLRMALLDGAPAGAPLVDYYQATVRAEQSNRWSTLTYSGEDTWFWAAMPAAFVTATHVYTTQLTALAAVPVSATVRAELAPLAYGVSVNPNVRLQFWLNTPGTLLTDTLLTSLGRLKLSEALAPSALREGQNTLTVTIPSSNLEVYFDWFEVEYARRFQAVDNQLTFSDNRAGARQYAAGHFTTDTLHVLDISNPWQPQRVVSSSITAAGGLYTATFELTASAPVTTFIGGADQLRAPKQIRRYEPPDLGDSNGADYLIITQRSFITAMQPLAAQRAADGLRVQIIDVDDLYNQFTDGLYHPLAIKNFLKYAYAHWQPPAPVYVLLVGDGHWNFKNSNPARYGQSPPNYMPPNLAWVDPYQGEVDSTNELVELVGGDRLPDMLIGRLPVSTTAEAAVVVSKIISYEAQAKSLPYRQRLLFVADNVPDPKGAGDFVQLSNDLINSQLPAGYAPDRLYANHYGCAPGNSPCPQVNTAITTTLNQTGALFVNYIGHASLNRWGDESFLLNANLATLNNLDRLPIILSMTCLDGYWFYPNNAGLMETMLRAANGGSVASFSPTGLGVSTGHDQLERGLLTAVFQQGFARLGQAALAGKVALFTAGQSYDLIDTYMIFGDPALRLPTYAVEVSPAGSVRFGSPNTTVQHTIYLTNTGFLTNTPALSIAGQTWPLTVSQANVLLLPGQSTALLVSVTIPLTAPLGATDVATLTFRSLDDSAQSVVGLVTINGLYGAMAVAQPASQPADPGAVVTYTVQITNEGVLTDTFDLSVSEASGWPVQLSAISLINLPPHGQTAFDVWVTAPIDQVADSAAATRVNIASRGGLGHLNTAVLLTTTLNPVYGVTLVPAAASQIGLSGQTLVYTLALTNTGNATNTFGAIVHGAAWPTILSPMTGLLPPWSSVNLPVTVNVPPNAGRNALDAASITVTMTLGGLEPQTATLSTTANPFQILLPLIRRN